MKQIELKSRWFYKPVLFTLVDDADYEFLSKFNWHARRSGKIYAQTKLNGKHIGMHTMLLPTDVPGLIVDHINGNTLDNRRSNLRLATRGENNLNSSKFKNNTSGYKGVTYDKAIGQWKAQLTCDGVNMHLGRFQTAREAAAAYNKAAFQNFGEYAKLNELSSPVPKSNQQVDKGEANEN